MQFVFVGFLIGSVAWGAFADKYGRKRVNPPYTAQDVKAMDLMVAHMIN